MPGCDRPAVHLHHVEFYEHGGPTDKANLAGLCWHHHQRIHLDGFTLTGNADHHLEWRDQRGRLIGTTRPALHQRLLGRPPPTT
ncbi:MAG: HNH endonuclease [Acidimicrobiales bacterium]|nr:HNH endonuclease [Acidimicrobiales bacterium]